MLPTIHTVNIYNASNILIYAGMHYAANDQNDSTTEARNVWLTCACPTSFVEVAP